MKLSTLAHPHLNFASLSRGRRTGRDGDVPRPAVIRPCIVPFVVLVSSPFLRSSQGLFLSEHERLQAGLLAVRKGQFPASRARKAIPPPSSLSGGCDRAASWNRSAKGASIGTMTFSEDGRNITSLLPTKDPPFVASLLGAKTRSRKGVHRVACGKGGLALITPRNQTFANAIQILATLGSCWFPLAGRRRCSEMPEPQPQCHVRQPKMHNPGVITCY